MSTRSKIDVTCECGEAFKADVWQSVNVTASPELRDEILNGQMNVVTCPGCGRRFHVEIPFLYHDLEKREWIWVYPLSYEKNGFEVYQKVHEMWEDLKRSMPPKVRERFEKEYKVTVLFGMDALVYYLRSQANGGGKQNQ